ncbi:MAG: hypothetical protein K2X32_09175 [Phycisphaerales bacterium]|nr:hypothetical protein [Phycisphaerales bacterium]
MFHSRSIVAALAIATLTGSSALAQFPFSDNFDTENTGFGQLNYATLANWTVTEGSVDLIGNGFFDYYPGNGLYLDLAGTTGQGGTISTAAFNFAPGNYVLAFTLAGRPDNGANINTVNVNLGSLYSNQFALPSSQGVTEYIVPISVLAPTSAALRFEHVEDTNAGALLLSASINIPAPTAAATLALAALASGRRRR